MNKGLLIIDETESYLVATIVGDNRWKVNSYLVTLKQSRRSFLIDPGGNKKHLLSVLLGLEASVEFVLLTHGHFDHMSSAAPLCEEFTVPCVVHSGDAKLLRQSPFYAFRFDGSRVSVPGTIIPLNSPDIQDLLASEIRVIHTPGHTPGSVCYSVGSFVFTGDTLLREAVGRTDQPGGNRDDLILSINELLENVPDDGIILPGHGKPWNVVEARLWWLRAAESPPVLDRFL